MNFLETSESRVVDRADETELIRRAQAGESEAFCELSLKYGSRLMRHATAMCGDVNAAEDLAQETLVEAWNGIQRYNGRCQIFTWFCSIMLHRHRNMFRKKRPLAFSFLGLGDFKQAESNLVNLEDSGGTPNELAQMAERTAMLLRSLERLPTKQRMVVYLRFYAQESIEGIAAALGCSAGTVRSRLFFALERMRKMKVIEEDFR